MAKKLDYRHEHFRMHQFVHTKKVMPEREPFNPEKHPRRVRALKAKRASSMV